MVSPLFLPKGETREPAQPADYIKKAHTCLQAVFRFVIIRIRNYYD
jgi:hypothetical protein